MAIALERSMSMLRNVLFLCSQNRLRSPTAEQVFAGWPGIEVASAGLNHDAEVPLTPGLLAWAESVFVMERAQRSRLQSRFRACLGSARVVVLDVPDDYAYMDPALVRLLQERVSPHLSR